MDRRALVRHATGRPVATSVPVRWGRVPAPAAPTRDRGNPDPEQIVPPIDGEIAAHGFGILVAASGLGKAWPSRRIVHALTPEGYRMDAALASPTIVRRTLEELGPTFIKLGRILSTRPGLPGFRR